MVRCSQKESSGICYGYEREDGNLYNLLTQERYCRFNCADQIENIISTKGVTLIEDFKQQGSITRNLILTTKSKKSNLAQRYTALLDKKSNMFGNKNAYKLRFIVSRLSCESISMYLRSTRIADLKHDDVLGCQQNIDLRAIWFSIFAYHYGVSDGGLSPYTCFVDLHELGVRSKKGGSIWAQDVCIIGKDI